MKNNSFGEIEHKLTLGSDWPVMVRCIFDFRAANHSVKREESDDYT
jgi:hypothetical protein